MQVCVETSCTVCIRLHHFKLKSAKAPYHPSHTLPPPPHSLRSLGLGRYAPSQYHPPHFTIHFVPPFLIPGSAPDINTRRN